MLNDKMQMNESLRSDLYFNVSSAFYIFSKNQF